MRSDGAGTGATEAENFHTQAPSARLCAVGVAGNIATRGHGPTELAREGCGLIAITIVAILDARKSKPMLMTEASTVLA